jgi:hypothetical protein
MILRPQPLVDKREEFVLNEAAGSKDGVGVSRHAEAFEALTRDPEFTVGKGENAVGEIKSGYDGLEAFTELAEALVVIEAFEEGMIDAVGSDRKAIVDEGTNLFTGDVGLVSGQFGHPIDLKKRSQFIDHG